MALNYTLPSMNHAGGVLVHAVNVYVVLQCVDSVSFTSKLPQSNGPVCLENELSSGLRSGAVNRRP